MSKKIDMTGWKMWEHGVPNSQLTVIGEADCKPLKWMCECSCGNRILVRGADLRNGHTNSCGCYQRKKTSEARTTLIEVGTRFNWLTVMDNETKHRGDILLRHCLCDCGNETWVSAKELKNGHTTSCGCRLTSKGEELIISLLNIKNLKFIKEKKFNDLIFQDTNKPARFDFYVNDEYLIEFDGVQHFKQGNGYYDNKEKFNKTQEHDRIKNEYCIKNNIPLIRIPYTHLDSLCIEDLLLETSSFIINKNTES